MEGVAAGTDRAFLDAEGTNVKKSSDVVTLDYTEVEWLSQQFATRTESVTPFLVSFWQSTIKLTPSSDTWTDTARLDAKIIQQEGNFAGVMAQAMQEFGVDPQTGLSPIQWNSWETNWSGVEQSDRKEMRDRRQVKNMRILLEEVGLTVVEVLTIHRMVEITTTKTFEDTIRDTFKIDNQTRTELERLLLSNLIMNL